MPDPVVQPGTSKESMAHEVPKINAAMPVSFSPPSANSVSQPASQRERRCQPMDTANQREIPFEQLIRENLVPATRFARQLAGNDELAEELAQEAMLRAVRNRKNFRGESQFSTWLFQIIVNAFRDHLKKHKPELLGEKHQLHTKEPTPHQQLAGQEMKQQINNAIEQLPERQRTVLVLSAWQQCSAEEIATIAGMSLENVYSTLSLARRRLKVMLQNYLSGDAS